ncbi:MULTISPECIES: B3/4 domain-containing protein [unclassified Bacillus (in: firmicutes)]|uniref:B3/B4 domain-containing protein n=1 Tax=unclassified Bacillus (in: firmicutes) TaxID=185979 RepID=UPI0008E91613|nr:MULTISPECIES: phenylalanine--tRNA ligase beta subunit-related protein [unclassified Bacillus (in: firmicutes)]SFA81688.1 B3/B4 domain-containing protein (DNA/RNA-binding domain of Phe-tRNA-synthetase) [Bacillus sp. UNCCL13]SFQ71770.1 B3/B4 domain-containing protein (DNA/RNA-binding domain of Phe-tRNA-synthetase) [Bacillus sp. cl95]
MEINISSEVCSQIPAFKIGVIHYEGISVGDSPQMLKGRLQLFQESLYFDLEEKSVNELEGIKEWRQIFKSIGKDPNRYRHSAEALYRRIQKQNYLPSIQSATDLNNFYSLQYQVPIGIYDLTKLSGDIALKIGQENDEYTGLNGRSNSLHNLLVSCDDHGPFGSPFVDSDRAPVTMDTKNALQIIYLRPSLNTDQCEQLTESLMNMFIQIHGGNGQFKVIGCL